jgi:hypothetical protein
MRIVNLTAAAMIGGGHHPSVINRRKRFLYFSRYGTAARNRQPRNAGEPEIQMA